MDIYLAINNGIENSFTASTDISDVTVMSYQHSDDPIAMVKVSVEDRSIDKLIDSLIHRLEAGLKNKGTDDYLYLVHVIALKKTITALNKLEETYIKGIGVSNDWERFDQSFGDGYDSVFLRGYVWRRYSLRPRR